MKQLTPREAAYLALIQDQTYIDQFLSTISLSSKDHDLAYAVAQGVRRRVYTLDHYLHQIQEKVKLKKKEKFLVYTALYQFIFMDRIPAYAIVDETIRLVKKYCAKQKVAFINALLRKVEETTFSLPDQKDPISLSIVYSYPQFFVEKMLEEYGLEKTEDILKIFNETYPTSARVRKPGEVSKNIIQIKDKSELKKIAQDSNYYIQNFTPIYLIEKLSNDIKDPEKILDLCASPGGKLLLAHDLYPKAKLFANDISEKRVKLLEENCKKYAIDAEISQFKAEEFPSDQKFDLIILDVPCSNSGVLHKKAEARWRITPEAIEGLNDLQFALLEKAKTLLTPNGIIWYMTCSIISQENEAMIEKAKKLSLYPTALAIKQFPDDSGKDGGFGCALKIG